MENHYCALTQKENIKPYLARASSRKHSDYSRQNSLTYVLLLIMQSLDWKEQNVLVTGGTGSFGTSIVRTLLKEYRPAKIIVFSRDELKQHEMRASGFEHPSLRYFIGDVRDRSRLHRALEGVDIVIHAAAMKQVPACEYNPFEAVLTNVNGTTNVVDAALDQNVKKCILISTDKAVSPANLYGATKLVAEKLFIHGNNYSSSRKNLFSCARYGNVVGSRGSVVPIFQMQKSTGTVNITDERMTRFWITLDQAVRFVISCIEKMEGKEIFVPKIPSMKITDLAHSIAPHAEQKVIGIRNGEKIHETLISSDEGRLTIDDKDRYILYCSESHMPAELRQSERRRGHGFCYTSDTNPDWLTGADLEKLIDSNL